MKISSTYQQNHFKMARQWLLVAAAFLVTLHTTVASVIVTPFCENATVSSREKGPKELLSAVKNNRPQMVMVLTSKGLNIHMKTDSGDSLLHVAVMCGSNDVTRTLLKLGEDPNVKGYNGLTPIYRATEMNDVDAMKELYAKGADINVKSGSVKDGLLHIACQKGHEDAANWLFSVGDPAELVNARNNRSVTPLHACAQNGHLNLAKFIVNRGGSIFSRDTEGNTPLHYAARKGHLEIVKYLVEKGANVDATSNFGITPLHRASEGGFVTIAETLLDNGASVNAMMSVMGVSPLHLAIFSISAVKILIDRGADVNLKTHSGETPLHWAASGAGTLQPNVLKELIDRGSDVNSQMRNGWTPLHIASLHGLRKNAEKLLENGASVNIKDSNGRVPLHFAAARGDVELIKILLNRGAVSDIKDADGETPLNWSKNCGNIDAADLLNAH